MSLIGPRPEVPKLTVEFNAESPGFVTRLMVAPVDYQDGLKLTVDIT